MKLNKQVCGAIRSRMEAVLADVAAEFDLTVEVKGGSYDPHVGTYKPKIEFAAGDADQKQFEQSCSAVGLKPEHFGAVFTYQGKTHEIAGLNLRARKYPVNVKCRDDGKSYRFPEDTVKMALGVAVAPPLEVVFADDLLGGDKGCRQ